MTTSYNGVSDYRLKEDFQPMVDGLAKINQLNPVTFKWKSDGSDGEGFIAHKLQSVIPLAVQGEKDAVGKDGSLLPQSLDPRQVVAHLVKAIQKLSAKVAALEANATKVA